MRRIAIASALLIAVAISSGLPAHAGAEVVPSAYKILKGSAASGNPLAELANDDDQYFGVNANNADVASYQVTFTAIPKLTGNTRFRIILLAKGTASCDVRMWRWRTERFIIIDKSIAVGSSEDETFIAIDNPSSYIRNNKARSKVTCKDDSPFILGTELARFIP